MNKFHAQLAVNQEGVEEDMDRLVVECKCGAVFSVEVSCYLDTKIGCECGQLYGWFTDTDTLEALEEATERRQLLSEIATKPIRSFMQLDHFANDEMYATPTREFNRTGCLRLLIPTEGYAAEDVKRGVRLMLEWLESGQPPFSHYTNGLRSTDELDQRLDGWDLIVRTGKGETLNGGGRVHVLNGNTIVQVNQENTNQDVTVLVYHEGRIIRLGTDGKYGHSLDEIPYGTEAYDEVTAELREQTSIYGKLLTEVPQ